ncbi:hypothetical protein A7U60_g3625 [Sanghuangporus baumii]|uniref:Peptidase C14 caspase domain-containing protein n=1 Tax=Sanghuangporus baumii TaxID=108892 RepID=A0A9Q5HZX9_SANBA|nr:hypothetical protein A7U60_g3625 [Sanghuangporus baumii]
MPGTLGSNAGDGTKRQERPVESRPPDQHKRQERNAAAGISPNRPLEEKDKKKEAQMDAAENDKGGRLFGSIFDHVKSGLKSTHAVKTENDQPTNEKPAESQKRTGKRAVEREETSQKSNIPSGKTTEADSLRHGPTATLSTARRQSQSSRLAPDSQREGERKRSPKEKVKDNTGNPPTVPEAMLNDEPEAGLSMNLPEIRIDEAPSPAKEGNMVLGKEKKKATKEEGNTQRLKVPNRNEAERARRRQGQGGYAKAERRKSIRRSTTEYRSDEATKQASKDKGVQSSQSRPGKTNVHVTSEQAETPRTTKQTPADDHSHNYGHEHSFNDTTAATLGIDTQFTSQGSNEPSREYVEAKCAICGFPIYVDPQTGERVDLQNPPQELCPVCGQSWPLGKPYTKEMEDIINRRLGNSPFKDVFCKRCASTVNAGGEVRDQGVQVDERDLNENDTKGFWREDHYCMPMEFERDKTGVKVQIFPSDPMWRGGTKRALLIGTNYSGQKGELKGCRNDVKNIYNYLTKPRCLFLEDNGYEDKNMDILMDVKPFKSPTKKNILTHMKRFILDTVDRHRTGEVTNWTGRMNVRIPKGSQLTLLLSIYRLNDNIDALTVSFTYQSCHSGSILDIIPGVLLAFYLPYTLANGRMTKVDFRKQYTAEEILNNGGTIILWSGCQDKQTSADTKIRGTAVGAMSSAFIKANRDLLKEKNGGQGLSSTRSTTTLVDYTYEELLDRIRIVLGERSQVAQLSSTMEFAPKRKKVYV